MSTYTVTTRGFLELQLPTLDEALERGRKISSDDRTVHVRGDGVDTTFRRGKIVSEMRHRVVVPSHLHAGQIIEQLLMIEAIGTWVDGRWIPRSTKYRVRHTTIDRSLPLGHRDRIRIETSGWGTREQADRLIASRGIVVDCEGPWV